MLVPLAIVSLVLSAGVAAARGGEDDVSYDDLKRLNVSCFSKDSCEGRKLIPIPGVDPEGYQGISPYTSCSCHAECSLFGTCCADAPARGKFPASLECGAARFPARSSGYYMVHACPGESPWRRLCEGDFRADGDVLKIAPVTSLDTFASYRNFYCLRCHESTDQFLHWELYLEGGGSGGPTAEGNDFDVRYNRADDTWSAVAVDGSFSVNVTLKFSSPSWDSRYQLVSCDPLVVGACPDSWRDDAVRRKCGSYTALLFDISGRAYRNAHCALCNSRLLSELSCAGRGHGYATHTFSFAHLIDISRSDRGAAKCGGAQCADGELCDPYARKCRKLLCALPGYVIKGGKCTAP